MTDQNRTGTRQPAFLLAQLGAHAASEFARKLEPLQLGPPDAGILRMMRAEAGLSQQELASRLHIHPSRLVAILDNLQNRGLIERQPNSEDRRLYSLHLTAEGVEMLTAIGKVARAHQQDLLGALSPEEQEQLGRLLEKLADQQGLTPGVHPGYQRLGRPKRD